MLKVDVTVFAYSGLHWAMVESLIREVVTAERSWATKLYPHGVYGDALISRSRSRELSRFLEHRTSDVLVMVDRDIAWEQGNLVKMAKRAYHEDAIIGGVYSCRAFGSGAQRLVANNFVHGGDKLHEAEYLATGFLAIPRWAAQQVRDYCMGLSLSSDPEHAFSPHRVERCKPDVVPDVSYCDFFRPFVLNGEYLSEDYAFCARARAAGVKLYASENPVITHWGDYGYTLADVLKGDK